MTASTAQPAAAANVWALVRRQHGVVTRGQLVAHGMGAAAIRHRLSTGRLHRCARGVYAVGRPQLTREGSWMAAVLSCGLGAALSHGSAAALWGIDRERTAEIEVSVPAPRAPRRPGIRVHRRANLTSADVATHLSIPLTNPTRTLLDLASRLSPPALEYAINEADKLDRIDPERLRSALDRHPGQPGVAVLRGVLDRRTFTLTDSELERRFLPITREAGLALPLTGQRVNGFKVDFYWPDLGLVVETDGLRYHRTAAQQTRDRRRDQAHAGAGLTPLRFTHAQIASEPEYVRETLTAVVGRLCRPITSGP